MDKKRFIVIMSFIFLFILLLILSFLYYRNKYSVYFETGTEEFILSKYVYKNEKVEKPVDPTKEGYIFKEWQLNGETYDFNTNVTEDIILTAKWIKEEYITVSFNTNSSDIIKSKKILKSEKINELPIANKENYEFIGWYINGKLYNNEEIYDDIQLSAEYKNEKINTTYKMGDMVKITGKYSSSAYSINAYNRKAIGWERMIIDIIEDGEFPYVVGNELGVTGFFKANSLEKL